MVFVTVGSQKFQFNRLLAEIDRLVSEGIIKETVFAQTGESDYTPSNYEYVAFLDRDSFSKKLDECNVVITHGGTGVIISAIKKGKKVLAVPRLAKYGEHVDDHQLQLLKQFEDANLISVSYDVNEMKEKYINMLKTSYDMYESNTQNLIDSIDEYIQSLG